MRLIRTILIAVIAISVAAVPSTAGFVLAAKASEGAIGHTVGMSSMPTGCEHHRPAAERGSRPSADCDSMAACAANCFNYAGTVVPAVAPGPTAARLQPIAAAGLVASNIGHPPFRPPRI